MKEKVKFFGVFLTVGFLVSAALAGNVCTWIGGAGDGKWSSAANWEGGVVPGAGDIAWLSGSNTATINNDVENLSLVGIWFTNTVPVTLTGGKITLTGDANVRTNWFNTCPVTCYAPLDIVPSHATARHMIFDDSTTISNDVTSSSKSNVFFSMEKTNKKRELHIYGAVTMPSASVYFQATLDSRNIHLHGPVAVKKLAGSGSAPSGAGWYYLYQPATYGALEIAYRRVSCEAENVLCPTSPVSWTGSYQGGELRLNGHDQTCNWLGGVYYSGTNAPNDTARVLSSVSPATLTVRATQSSTTYAIVTGKVSIVYAPAESSLVQTFSIRTNTTAGALIVSNGTVKIDAGSLWRNLPEIRIWKDAALEISATNGIANPFPALKTVYIQPGGKLKIPSGVALTAERVLGLGVTIEDGTYSQNASGDIREATWIEGTGTLTVTHVGSFADWKRPVTGAWSDGANWVGGTAPSAVLPAQVLNDGEDFTVRVSADAAVATNLTAFAISAFGDPGETTFDVTALWPFYRAWISLGAGTKVEVGNGGHFRYDGGETAAAGDAIADDRIVLKDGAQLTVKSGGTFSVTNARGRVTVGGGSANSTGTLKVEAGGLFDFYPGVKDVVVDVEKGGLVDVAGTMRLHRRNDNGANLLRMAGGEMRFSGDAFLQLHGDPTNVMGVTGGYLQFGTGKATFSDSAHLQFTGGLNYNAHMVVAPTANGETAEVVFDGSSGISNSVQNLYIGNNGNDAIDGSATMTMKKGSYWRYGSASTRMANQVFVGYRKGKGVLNVAGATIQPGFSGIRSGHIDVARTDRSTEGEINLSDGALMVVYGQAGYSRSAAGSAGTPLKQLFGTTVGYWLRAPSGVTGRPAVGRINITGDTTTVDAIQGHVIVGAGAAEGTILMDGKEFTVVTNNTTYAENKDGSVTFREYATNSVMAIGMLTGKGAFIQTAGRVLSNLRTYVGGCETNQYFDGAYIATDPCRIGQRTAEGLLCISNGTFAATKEVYVGTDGAGTIQVGPTGTFTAKTLVLSNQTSSVMRFVFDENGFSGGVTVTNLVIASGAKLEVDARGYTGMKTNFNLLKASSVTGDFADQDITITTDSAYGNGSLEWRNGSLVFSMPSRGMILILR